MIFGIGIDIIDINRIRRVYMKYGQRFLNKCFSEQEITKSEKRFNKIETLAKRYAAKEACAKALGTGLARGVFWKDIEVRNNINGKPYIILHNKAKNLISSSDENKLKVELSLTDEKEYALANVVIYR